MSYASPHLRLGVGAFGLLLCAFGFACGQPVPVQSSAAGPIGEKVLSECERKYLDVETPVSTDGEDCFVGAAYISRDFLEPSENECKMFGSNVFHGECHSVKYLAFNGGFASQIYFFDPCSDELIGTRETTDDGSFCWETGGRMVRRWGIAPSLEDCNVWDEGQRMCAERVQ